MKIKLFVMLSVVILFVLGVSAAEESNSFTSPLPTPTPPGGGEGSEFDWTEFLEWLLEHMNQIVGIVVAIIVLILSWLNREKIISLVRELLSRVTRRGN